MSLLRQLLLIGLFTPILFIGCASKRSLSTVNSQETVDQGYIKEKKKSSTSKGSSVKNNKTYTSLSQYLRTIPGIRVTGTDATGSVQLVGVPGNLIGEVGPLFIVDGTRVGRELSSVAALLNPNEIARVSVLKSPSETGFYGSDGAYGVIVIRLKKK